MKQRTRPMHHWDDFTYNMDKRDDGDSHSDIQLHRIKPQDHFIEAQVQDGDTLQAIALRFYCSIAELKRINHIDKDNEIFARRIIKVPVTPYSVLTELIPTQNSDPAPSTSSPIPNTNIKNVLLSNNLNGNPQNNVSNETKDGGDFSIDCNSVVMNSTLLPTVMPYLDTEPSDQITEDTKLLPANKEKICIEHVVVKELTSHGADFGLKWFHLVCCVLILGVIVPLVYIKFYLKVEHPDVNVTSHPTLLSHHTEPLDLPPLQSLN